MKKVVRTRYSIDPARFVTHGEDRQNVLGPVVIWIGVYPGSTSADTAHDVSQDILSILKENGVEDVEVEWREAVTEKVAGPPLLPVVDTRDPTAHIRRHLTATIGMPIVIAHRQDVAPESEGTIRFFFHEGRDGREGKPSSKVFAVSSHHVLCKSDKENYDYKGNRCRQRVRASGFSRFQQGFEETAHEVANRSLRMATYLRTISSLKNGAVQNKLDAEKDKKELLDAEKMLRKELTDIAALKQFYDDVTYRPSSRSLSFHLFMIVLIGDRTSPVSL